MPANRRTGLGPVRPRQQLCADRGPRGAQMHGRLVDIQTIYTGYAFVAPLEGDLTSIAPMS
jgi:hypothetical protein